MSTTNRMPTPTNEPIDRVLSDFFKAQMPQSWPKAPIASRTQPSPTAVHSTGDQMARTRWALAASIALLVGTCWYLTGRGTAEKPATGMNLEGGTASPSVIDKNLGKTPPVTKPSMP